MARLKGGHPGFHAQARSLYLQTRHVLPPKKRRAIASYVHHRDSTAQRLRFAIIPPVYFQRFRSDLFFKLLVLIGRA